MAEISERRFHYFTVREIALDLRVTERTVRNWIAAGELKITRAGRRVLVEKKDLADFLKRSDE